MKKNVEDDVLQIVFEQDVTADRVESLKNELLIEVGQGHVKIAIDMSAVELIDSSGVSLLIALQNSVASESGSLSVNNLSDNLVNMFKIMGLDRHFTISGR